VIGEERWESAGWPWRAADWRRWGVQLSNLCRRLLAPGWPGKKFVRRGLIRLTPQHSLHWITATRGSWLIGCYPGGMAVIRKSMGRRRRARRRR
jgi:hypothetical protein